VFEAGIGLSVTVFAPAGGVSSYMAMRCRCLGCRLARFCSGIPSGMAEKADYNLQFKVHVLTGVGADIRFPA
jgi:hypothetical protein